MKQLTYCLTLFFICKLAFAAIINKGLLYNQISALERNLPDDHTSYVSEIISKGEFRIENFSTDQVENKLKEFGFSDFVKNKFRGILFAHSLTFQSFSLVISNHIGHLDQIVGYADNTNNQIQLVFINTQTRGKLQPKSDLIMDKICVKIFFIFDICKPIYRYAPRGYHTWELNKIEEILRANSFKHLKQKFDEIRNANYLADMSGFNNNSTNTNKENSLLSIVNSNQNIFQKAIDDILADFQLNTYINQLGKNIQQIIKSITVQNFELKYDEEQVKFSNFFCGFIDSSEENCNFWFTQLLKKNLAKVINQEERTKSIFRICLMKNNEFEFAEILISYNEDTINKGHYFDVEMKYLKQSINSPKKLLLVKSRNDEDYYELNTNEKINDDEKVLLNLLEVMFQLEEENEQFNVIKIKSDAVSFLQDS